MNDIIRALESRRSIRKYKPDMVPKEMIDQVIEAGLYAPSAMGRQDAIVLAVTNRKLRDRLSAMNAKIMGIRDGSDPFYGAPVVLIVLAPLSRATRKYDGSLIIGNMMLAAYSLGLGSCWINRALQEFESEEGRKILRDLGIEGEYEGIGHCILGWPDGAAPQAAPRKPGRVYYAE